MKSCNAANCPNGCCDKSGKCQPGTTINSCGGKGMQCADCITEGFDFCDPMRRSCARNVRTCDATSCPDGCCVGLRGPKGSLCYSGTSQNACGGQGDACQNCAAQGETCDPLLRRCASVTCNPGNCPGCCLGNECRVGQDNTLCGQMGGTCQDCTAQGTSCISTGRIGGQCEGPVPSCSPTTCPSGCCLGDQCIGGTSDTACGTGAQACVNCAGQGDTCKGQVCVPVPVTCTTANCPGCCDGSQVCHGGFLNARCGSGAAACVDCVSMGSTCDLAVTPRICANQQTTCPAPYPSCPDGISTPAPPLQHVCPSADLQDARAACASGAHSASCAAFFSFEQTTNPSCASCLTPFDFTFEEAKGIYSCVAPYVTASCDHQTACAIDCQTSSCAMCTAANVTGCESSVRTGQCGPYFGQTACVRSVFGGTDAGAAGAFCNPFNYAGYGDWLQGVGGHYCLQ